MSEEQIETVVVEDENEPIYFKPKILSLIATIAAWVSWVVLVVFILIVGAQISYIIGIGQQNGKTLVEMLSDAQQGEQVRLFVYQNCLLPLFTGITYFVLLQAAGIGLNVLLEHDFSIRELRK